MRTHIILLGLISNLLVACSTPLRYPVCQSNEMVELPDLPGTYRISITSTDAINESLTSVDDLIVEIEQKNRDGFAVYAKDVRSLKKFGFHFDTDSYIRVCRPDGKTYVSQTLTGGGLYSIDQITMRPEGFSMHTLAFSRETLEKLNIPYFILPRTTFSGGSYGEASVDLIVNNESVSSEDIMKAARVVSFFGEMRFDRISAQSRNARWQKIGSIR